MSAEESLSILARPEWHKQAACRGVYPDRCFWEINFITYDMVKDDFFYSEKAFKRLRKIDLAAIKEDMEAKFIRDYCSVCPVKAECGQAGKYEPYGIWGGETFEERFENMTEAEKSEFLQRQGITEK